MDKKPVLSLEEVVLVPKSFKPKPVIFKPIKSPKTRILQLFENMDKNPDKCTFLLFLEVLEWKIIICFSLFNRNEIVDGTLIVFLPKGPFTCKTELFFFLKESKLEYFSL